MRFAPFLAVPAIALLSVPACAQAAPTLPPVETTTGSAAIKIDASSSVSGIAFPRQMPVEGERESMTALARGKLVLVGSCLRMGSVDGNLLVWPPDFTLITENDQIQVLNGAGQVVARVGEDVRMGGGQIGHIEGLGEYVRQQLSPDCPGPYWIVGEGVRLR